MSFSMTPYEDAVYRAALMTFKSPEWIVLPQVKVSTGFNEAGGERMIDLFIINTYPSKRYRSLAVEIKESASDFACDLRNPSKQVLAHLYCDEFYYCITDEMSTKPLPRGFSPSADGLMILRDGRIVTRYKPRNTREKIPWSHGFTCALMRRARESGIREGRTI